MVKTEEVTMYSAKCDRCGNMFEYSDGELFYDRQAMVETAEDEGWLFREADCFCAECKEFVPAKT